ncbi:hypothetical protein WJX77_011630 [Trebouxia sp. C0004]
MEGPAGGASPGIGGWTVDGWDVEECEHVNLEQAPTVESKPGFAAKTAATRINTDQDCVLWGNTGKYI